MDLVSIIIPCFNAEQWIKEAIDSCLNQIYSCIEVIVIDDGSTDDSVRVIKTFGNKVIWETKNREGSNFARNRGLNICSGKYIQFLDADDYLLPDKLAKQIQVFEREKVDIVYSSLKTINYDNTGSNTIKEYPDEQFDMTLDEPLISLLSYKHLLHTSSPLFKRDSLALINGWDTNIRGGQDRDLLISLAINKATFKFLPGCYSVRRNYNSKTRITSNRKVCAESHILLLQKAESKLQEQNRLSSTYQQALALGYFRNLIVNASWLSYIQYFSIEKRIIHLNTQINIDKAYFNSSSKIFLIMYKTVGLTASLLAYKVIKDTINLIKKLARRQESC